MHYSEWGMTHNIDELIYSAIFESDSAAHTQIKAQAEASHIVLASIHNLYQAIGQGEVGGFTVPAINLRTLTYDIAQVIFKLMIESKVGPVIFEIAISEQDYTHQSPHEFASSVLAAAIKTGYTGPVFLQGDHYQFKREKYLEDKQPELERIRTHIRDTIQAGFHNIDIDGSTLVDLEKLDLNEQQRENYTVTAAMTDYIRLLQPSGITISIGGEIGHIGGRNSTVEDFQAFMKGYKSLLSPGTVGMSKVSVQTGTHHGGVVRADGTLETAPIDFSVLKDIGNIARADYSLGGAVQHGASTLPDDLFHMFPENGALEIHLSTQFQNIVFDHLSPELRERMYTWARKTVDKQEGLSDEQFIYLSRKKALGEFKRELWQLSDSEKSRILSPISEKLIKLFQTLRIVETRYLLEKYVI